MIDKDDYCNGSWQVNMSEREEFEKYENKTLGRKNWDNTESKTGYSNTLVNHDWNIWQEQQIKIDALKALNPDVPCPVCGNQETITVNAVDGVYKGQYCSFCKHTGTVPLTKAQEYRIKELEQKVEFYKTAANKYLEMIR